MGRVCNPARKWSELLYSSLSPPIQQGSHLLLDGVQDPPHVLIHLQALEQSSFTGKREGLDLVPGRDEVEHSPPSHLGPGEPTLMLVTAT